MQFCEFGLSLELAEVLQAMKSYTSILERYLYGDTSAPSANLMCDQRNLIQYRLMSLPPARDVDERNYLYEVCRISAIIYSVGVTFPLPGVGAPFAALARLLKAQLEDWISYSHLLSLKVVKLFIWIVTLGGIAASDLHERTWFVEALSKFAEIAKLDQWLELKQTLKTILWLDKACDMAGEKLWADVKQLIPHATARRPLAILAVSCQAQSLPLQGYLERPCWQCRQRKIRCNKECPCQNCVKGGLDCSQEQPRDGNLLRLPSLSSQKRPCHRCRQRKIKCDNQIPCGNCVKVDSVCFYEAVNATSRTQRWATRQQPCDICRRRRIKCNKELPCQNCLKSDYKCSYESFSTDIPDDVSPVSSQVTSQVMWYPE